MKKCSQSHHHSLTELNITPLLDLAFVLLVIFIITTTPIVNDLDLSCSEGSDRCRHQVLWNEDCHPTFTNGLEFLLRECDHCRQALRHVSTHVARSMSRSSNRRWHHEVGGTNREDDCGHLEYLGRGSVAHRQLHGGH